MDRTQLYNDLYLQLSSLIEGESNKVAIMANAAALMRQTMGERFFWAGFYIVDGDTLVIGPFQGTVACSRIRLGHGVCGAAWQQKRTLTVPDVEQFEGHIACSSLSRSEIVVPIIKHGEVVAVIDVDSTELSAFDDADAAGLERVAQLLSGYL